MKLTIDFGMLEVRGVIGPARIGCERAVAGHLVLRRHVVEGAPRRVQAGKAGVAAAGNVEGRQIEWRPQQVIAHRVGDELVDFVARLAGQAADYGARGLVGRGTAGGELERVEESPDQPELLVGGGRRGGGIGNHLKIKRQAINGLRQHRVAEPENGVGEFGEDRRIDGDVVAVGRQKLVDARHQGARKFLKHQVLILHLGAETCHLEQALAVPVEVQAIDEGIDRCHIGEVEADRHRWQRG